MTIKMRLDTEGLRALIADNPTLQVEIGNEVMNNIKADFLSQAVNDRINACLDKMCPRENGWQPGRIIKDERIREAIYSVVKAEVKDMLKEAVEDAVSKATSIIDLRVRQEVKAVAKEVILESLTVADAKAILMEKLM